MTKKQTTIKNSATPGYVGILVSTISGREDVYFCNAGVQKVLGQSCFTTAQISKSPFLGSLRVEVKGAIFKSKHGEFCACYDHPGLVKKFLGGRADRKDFHFYIKID